MRLIHKVCSFTAAAVLIGAGITASVVPASAINVETPTEGQIVRDQVKIVVPKSSLQPDVIRSGFLTVKIDDQFTAAVGTRVDVSNGKSAEDPKIVFIWDSKRLTSDTEQMLFRDGRHLITVEAHNIGREGKETIAEVAKINVVLKNQVARPNPAPPVYMKYRYNAGQLSKYKVSVFGELLDANGFCLTGSQSPIIGEFIVDQSIEDRNPDGSALIRYKVEQDAFTQIFGQVNMLYKSGTFKSVYKIMDSIGRTVDANVLSSKSTEDITDCLIKLPNKSVQVGETWPTVYRMKLEGLCGLTDYSGTSTLEGLEWEGGYECAKIKSKLNGAPMFSFMQINGMVNTTSTSYFAYKPGKLIKSVDVIMFSTVMDSGTLSKFQQQSAGMSSSPSSPASSSQPSGYMSNRVAPSDNARSGSSGSSSGGPGSMTVTVRIVVTRELIK